MSSLRRFARRTPSRYRFPASVSFEHVSYHLGQESAIPPGLLARLNAGESADGFGQPVRLSNPLATHLPSPVGAAAGKACQREYF